MKNLKLQMLLSALVLLLGTQLVIAGYKDIQFHKVDFSRKMIEIINVGANVQSLDGWRLCSSDANEINKCTGSSGFNGISIAPGEIKLIRLDNQSDQPNQINISDLGGALAAPFSKASYSLQLFKPPFSLTNPASLAHHIQWSVDGIHNNTADQQSNNAVIAGLWQLSTDWIVTDEETVAIKRLYGIEEGVLSLASFHAVSSFEIPTIPMTLFASVIFFNCF